MGSYARVLPPGLVRFIRLIVARLTHRGAGIYSGFVSRRAKLGRGSGIGHDTRVDAVVSVGHGAVIGAGSVVMHDVPPYAIVAGSPAKIIKYRFEGATIERLLGMSWREWSEEKLIRNRGLFTGDSQTHPIICD
jgi:hypothetical protein